MDGSGRAFNSLNGCGSVWYVIVQIGGAGMADKKEKVLTYRRAIWVRDEKTPPIHSTLCGFIKQASNKLKDVAARTLARDNGQAIKLAIMKPDKEGGVYLHIVADTPGESASVVPKVKGAATEIKLGTAAPPPDTDFLDGDAFVYVRNDDVCLCGTAVHDATVGNFLRAFLRKAGLGVRASQFDLEKVANINKIKLMQSQGVKQIEFRSTLFKATADYHRRHAQPQGILGALGKQFKTVLGNVYDVNNDALRVELILKTDRRRKGITVGEKEIKTLAIDTLNNQEDDDEFVIVTKSDQRIGPKEIHMRSKVLIESNGKTVERDKAWDELIGFYNTLDKAGALEE
jgi:hypothetical protein